MSTLSDPQQVTTGAPPRLRRRTWLLAFVAFFVVTGSWSLATPPFASPDEPSHVYRAAAVVRGEILVSEAARAAGGGGAQDVPAGLVDSATEITCFAFGPNATADCAAFTAADSRLVEVQTGAARYNPFYYALVGWPSLVSPGDAGLYAMRLLSAALCSIALATAMTSALRWGRSRLVGAGLVIAVTPMTAFLAGVVNPNGFEIALAAVVWTSGLALWLGGGRESGVLLRRVGIAGTAMVLTRGLSPLWLAVVLVALLCLLGTPLLKRVLRQRATWVWAGVIALGTAASVGWTRLAGADQIPDLQPDTTFPAAVRVVLTQMPYSLEQYVGTFGWTDAYSPGYSLVVFTVIAGAVVVAGVLLADRWRSLVLVGLLVVSFWLPVLLEASQFNNLGLFWQARYGLPLVMGLPLVGAAVLAASPPVRRAIEGRVLWLVVPLALSVHLACFVWVLRRYQVGYDAPLSAFRGVWSPPLGSWTSVAVQAVGLALLWLVLAWSPWRRAAADGDAARRRAAAARPVEDPAQRTDAGHDGAGDRPAVDQGSAVGRGETVGSPGGRDAP